MRHPHTHPSLPPVLRCDHKEAYVSEKHGTVGVADPGRWLHVDGRGRVVILDLLDYCRVECIRRAHDNSELKELFRWRLNCTKFASLTLCEGEYCCWNDYPEQQVHCAFCGLRVGQLPNFPHCNGLVDGEAVFNPNTLPRDGIILLATSTFSNYGPCFAFGVNISELDFDAIFARKASIQFTNSEHVHRQCEDRAACLDDNIPFAKFHSILWVQGDTSFFCQQYFEGASHGKFIDASDTELDESGYAKRCFRTLKNTQGEFYGPIYTREAYVDGHVVDEVALGMGNHDKLNYVRGSPTAPPYVRPLIFYTRGDATQQNPLWNMDPEENTYPIGQNIKWAKLIGNWEAEYSMIENDDPRLCTTTNKDAPNHSVITTDIWNSACAAKQQSAPFIDQNPEAPMEQIKVANEDTWVVACSQDAKGELYLFNWGDKRLNPLPKNKGGPLGIFSRKDSHRFLTAASVFTPSIVAHSFEFPPKSECSHEPYFIGVARTDIMEVFMSGANQEIINLSGRTPCTPTLKQSGEAQGDLWGACTPTNSRGSSFCERLLSESPHISAAFTCSSRVLLGHKVYSSSQGEVPPSPFERQNPHDDPTHNASQLGQTKYQVFSGQMSAGSMFRCLVQHGCLDLTLFMNHDQYSETAITSGGFGDIWKGKLSDGTPVAIKVWRFASTTERKGDSSKRLMREIYTWSKINHENVHKLLGIIMFKGGLGMVSRWMDNGNLQAYIHQNRGVDRYKLCIQVARGVQYLHHVKIIHGDLKALNILVSKEGIPKLTDFDHSIMTETSLVFSESTQTGGGTVRWMAPELLLEEGFHKSKSTDVYALGMTLLEIITGMVPYPQCRLDVHVIRKLDKKILPSPTEHFSQGERGQRMWDLLVECWNHNSGARPTANEVFQQLSSLIEETRPWQNLNNCMNDQP